MTKRRAPAEPPRPTYRSQILEPHRPPPHLQKAIAEARLAIELEKREREQGAPELTSGEIRLRMMEAQTEALRPARVDAARTSAYTLVENCRTLCAELGDLLDVLYGSKHCYADTRALLGRLRTAEVELDAAAVVLAGQLGLVAV